MGNFRFRTYSSMNWKSIALKMLLFAFFFQLHASSSAQKKLKEDQSYGWITGLVVDKQNQPLISATIFVFNDGKLVGANISDYDGLFKVAPLEEGCYDVLCTIEDDSIFFRNQLVKRGERTICNVKMAKLFKRFNAEYNCSKWQRLPETVKTEIFGRITDTQGKSIANAIVQAFAQGKLIKRRFANLNGEFSISLLDTGKYDLLINSRGYDSITIKNIALSNRKYQKDIVMVRNGTPVNEEDD